MGRKELRAMVLEEYPKAFCRRSYNGGYLVYLDRDAKEVIGKGHSAKAAWSNAAELATAS